MLFARLHPRRRNDPSGRLQIDLPPPRSTNLAAASPRQRQETESQQRADSCAGGLHLRQRFPHVLGRQVPMVLPLLPARRQHRRESARRVVRPIAGRYAPGHDASDLCLSLCPVGFCRRHCGTRTRIRSAAWISSTGRSSRLGNACRSSSLLTCFAWSSPQSGDCISRYNVAASLKVGTSEATAALLSGGSRMLEGDLPSLLERPERGLRGLIVSD